jgi:SAM-dependent methyltransferase
MDDLDANYAALLPRAREARVLDVGCGTGRMLTYLLEAGYTAIEGVDRDAELVRVTGRDLGVPVTHVDDLAAWLDRRPGEFDLIIVRHMIYYLAAPRAIEALAAAERALVPGGRLVVEVVNAATLTGGFVKNKDLDIRCSYTEHSLSELLLRAGVRDVQVRGTLQARRGARRAAFILLNLAWQRVLRLIYVAERGFDPQNPRILTRNLIAVGISGRTP